MLWLSGVLADVARPFLDARRIGLMDSPANGFAFRDGYDDGWAWGADNGAFSDAWDADTWWRWLADERNNRASCLFAALPDVLADAEATRALADVWAEPVADLGYPVAYVAQDGSDTIEPPWDLFSVLFIGGTDAFKLGPVAVRLMARAHHLGKRVHVGRANSRRRLDWARAQHADTADGTFLKWGPSTNIVRVEGWLDWLDATPVLWAAAGEAE